ncbi:LytR/AlgR family response regulator transcription factor [Inhella sp.]|uniref:LytR/AlgR family response regulator transcription factor n=1 Tax=Inhella sp. TaxID=1921806 RepID=UPI0035AD94DF
MLKTLIAEDELLAREGLVDWVQAHPELELLGAVGDGPAALQAIRSQQPELVLMDIQMPGLTGLQVLRTLSQERPGAALPAVIFTTAYDEHALTAFELHAVDYLLKPFSRERFDEAISHVLQTQTVRPSEDESGGGRELAALEAVHTASPEAPLQRLLVRDMGRIVPLQVERIEHLRSDTKYTAIVTQGRTYLVRLPISHFGQRLDPQRFLKVNRSCIVNLDFVEALVPDESSQLVVHLRDGNRFTASREVSKQLRADSL